MEKSAYEQLVGHKEFNGWLFVNYYYSVLQQVQLLRHWLLLPAIVILVLWVVERCISQNYGKCRLVHYDGIIAHHWFQLL